MKAHVLFFVKKVARSDEPTSTISSRRTRRGYSPRKGGAIVSARTPVKTSLRATRPASASRGSRTTRWRTWINLPSTDVFAREIVEDLTAASAEFEAEASSLEAQLGQPSLISGSFGPGALAGFVLDR